MEDEANVDQMQKENGIELDLEISTLSDISMSGNEDQKDQKDQEDEKKMKMTMESTGNDNQMEIEMEEDQVIVNNLLDVHFT